MNLTNDKKKVSITQILGFVLLLSGAAFLIGSGFFGHQTSSGGVSVFFFITMLGFALTFPALLQGNDGLSTMRIVVFMMTNVICMLLLKIGWAKGVTNLREIGLDGYWMGVIAFVFGAKATQSYFESKLAVLREVSNTETPNREKSNLNYSNAEVAKLAVAQNEQYLKSTFSNILSISDTVDDLNSKETHLIAIYLKDSNTSGIPTALEVKMSDGTRTSIQTEIIRNLGKAKIQYSQLNSNIAREDDLEYTGSVCCGVKSTTNKNFKGVLTSAHIYSKGKFDDEYNGALNPADQTKVCLNNDIAGKWYAKVLNHSQDLAIAKLQSGQKEDTNYMEFNNQYYNITDSDVKTFTENVTMLSANDKTTTAFVVDYNVGLDIYYDDGPSYKRNIILISSTNDRETSTPVSEAGYSGSCVYHTKSKKLIGMLLGSNEKFSLVLPIEETLKSFNLNTI